MDRIKKQVFLKWWTELSGRKVHNLRELGSGTDIANVLLKCGEGLIPSDLDLNSSKSCISAIKNYLENFYQQSLDDGDLLNLQLIGNIGAPTDAVELEIGKLLLALLGCVIQDRARDTFIAPALKLDVESQNVMFGILSVFVGENSETKLYPGFETVLKSKQDHSRITMFSYSPQGKAVGNMRDISSPFRNMSLASPVTPLEALMSSPNFTQRAAIRQKNYECRRLESQLRTEQFLREEVELTLKDKDQILTDKEKTIRDLEKKVAENREMKYKLDELENMNQANQSLSADNDRLRNRIQELHTLQESNRLLMKEKTDLLTELEQTKDKLRPLEAIRERDDIFEVKYHKLRLSLPDLETALSVEKGDNESLRSEIKDLKETCEIIRNNCKTFKDKIKDLEEQLAATTESMVDSCQPTLGEELSVITEKKYAQLKAETESIQTDLTNSINTLTNECDTLREALEKSEATCQENQTGLLIKEEQLEQCKNELLNCKSTTATQESSLREASEQITSLQTEVISLTTSLESLKQSELKLLAKCEENEIALVSLRNTLGTCQTDLELKTKELRDLTERHNTQGKKCLELEQKMDELEMCKTHYENKISQLELENSKSEELQKSLLLEKQALEGRLKDSKEEIDKVKLLLQTEREENSEKITDLSTKLQTEESDNRTNQETNERLNKEIKELKESAEEEKNRLNKAVLEKRKTDEEIHKLSKNLSSTRESSEKTVQELQTKFQEKESSLKQEIQKIKSGKEECLKEQNCLSEKICNLNKTIEVQHKEIANLTENLKSVHSELINSMQNSKLVTVQFENKLASTKEKMECEKRQSANERQELIEQIKELQSQLEKEKKMWETEKLQVTDSVTREKEKNEEHKSKVLSLEEQIVTYKTQMSDQMTDINKIKQELKDSHDEIKTGENVRIELEESLRQKTALLESQVEELKYLKGVETSLNATIVVLQTDFDTMKNLVAERDGIKAEKNKKIKEVEEALESEQRKVEGLLVEQTRLTEEHESMVSKLNEENERLSKLTESLQMSKDEVFKKQEDTANELRKVAELLNQESEAHTNIIKEKNTMKEQLDKSVKDKEMVEKTFEECKKDYEKQVGEFKEKLSKNEQYWIEQCEHLREGYDKQISELTEIKNNHLEVNKQCNDQIEQLEKENAQKDEDLQRQAELKQQESDMLRGQIDQERLHLTDTHEKTLNTVVAEYQAKVDKLQGEVEAQRVSYQQMIGGMEEKLGGEALELRERLSQMKCMYETLIETKEKETSAKVSEMDKQKNEAEAAYKQLTEENKECTQHLKELQEKIDSASIELESHRMEAKQSQEEMRKQKGEVEEMKRQLQYNREITDTLTAELSSNQQQLAAVEEEKHVLELEVFSLEQKHNLQLDALGKRLDERSLEVEELERQLQASHKCYEAVQKTQLDLETQVKLDAEDHMSKERKCHELEKRLSNYLERENKRAADHQQQIDKAAELNGRLQCQMQALTEANQNLEREMQLKREKEAEYERDMVKLNEIQKKLEESEAEIKTLKSVQLKYKINYNAKKQNIVALEEKLSAYESKINDLKYIEGKLEKEETRNISLRKENRTLAEMNDLAERKLREYKLEMEKRNSVFLGDNSEFKRMMSQRDNAEDASFMEGESSIPHNVSVFERHDTDNHSEFYDDSKSLSETIMPNTRSRSQMGRSTSSSTVSSLPEKDADTVSIGSASSLAYRLRSRESAISLNRSFRSIDSCRSNASVPKGTGGIFHCEDEPVEMQWGRLDELKRRNTMCPAHLKTTYPVETQTFKPDRFQERALRESTVGNSRRKRKQVCNRDSSDSDSAEGKGKQSKAGCAYHKPGPPTPANQRRMSDRVLQSPGSRTSRSPKTPKSQRGRKYPKRTPRQSPTATNLENSGFAKQTSSQSNVAFNIGFSPETTGIQRPLRRQQAFVQKQPQSNGKNRKPLGTRNYLQTGV